MGVGAHHPHAHIMSRARWRHLAKGRTALDRVPTRICFLPVRVLSRLCSSDCFWSTFRRRTTQGKLQFFGNQAALADPKAFKDHLTPLRKTEWVVYAKRPFGGPEAVLAYLSRYTHRAPPSPTAASSRSTRSGVTFKWKDYRAKQQQRQQGDDTRRRRVHPPLPHPFTCCTSGFTPHPPLWTVRLNGGRAENISRARQLPSMFQRRNRNPRHRRRG